LFPKGAGGNSLLAEEFLNNTVMGNARKSYLLLIQSTIVSQHQARLLCFGEYPGNQECPIF
jgi:hypothetical protein